MGVITAEMQRICFCARHGIGPHWHNLPAGCPARPHRDPRRPAPGTDHTTASTEQLLQQRARIDDELTRRGAA